MSLYILQVLRIEGDQGGEAKPEIEGLFGSLVRWDLYRRGSRPAVPRNRVAAEHGQRRSRVSFRWGHGPDHLARFALPLSGYQSIIS